MSPLVLVLAPGLGAQTPADLARERADFAVWLGSAPTSPYAAIALARLQREASLGPADADLPLEGLARVRVVEERGALRLVGPEGTRALPRERPVALGPYRILASGEPGRVTLTVYGPIRNAKSPRFYPYAPSLVFTGPLRPPDQRRAVRMLALHGVEIEATYAGAFEVGLPTGAARLAVYRMPEPGTEEAPLMIYFRDSTNADGTYPAGRFVELVPRPGGRFLLDFNRARNPFCAYSTVYACPVPWPGNAVPARIEAGERYAAEEPVPGTRRP